MKEVSVALAVALTCALAAPNSIDHAAATLAHDMAEFMTRTQGRAFIADNEEVVLYFAKGMEGLHRGPGQLWLYDDSHIASLGARRGVPPATTCVTLR